MKNLFIPLLFGVTVSACKVEQKQPNILLIITDDQGWGDVGIHGNPLINTPTLDKLYGQSAVLNHFYATPLSSTTRAGLLTGRYHLRTGVSTTSGGFENMNPEETTIAEVLKESGYQTGCFGKWHNGAYFPYTPNGQGFDEFTGFCCGLVLNYFNPLLQHNEEQVREKGYITDIFADKAIQFIERNKDKPFFCYVPFNAPHSPYQVPDEYFDRYAGLTANNPRERDILASIYGMVENVDYNISRILDKLEQLNLMENTIVVFMSDNGPTDVRRFNGNMRGMKTQVYEGGVRVPCYISWKGKIHHHVIDEPTANIDIMPTLLSLCGITGYQTAFPIDGLDLKGLIEEKTDRLPDRMIFTHRLDRTLHPYIGSLRTRDYRLSVYRDSMHLFHIKNDPQENNNLYHHENHGAIAKKLHEAYFTWYEEASKNVYLNPVIPVGYDESRMIRIEATEGKLHGQVKYDSSRSANWIYQFQTPDDYMSFELDAVRSGNYEILIEYSQPDEGSYNVVAVCGSSVVKSVLPQYVAEIVPSPNRVPFHLIEKVWGKQSIGVVPLLKGRHTLKLFVENASSKDIQIKTVIILKNDT